jgi:hypothetical protein
MFKHKNIKNNIKLEKKARAENSLLSMKSEKLKEEGSHNGKTGNERVKTEFFMFIVT